MDSVMAIAIPPLTPARECRECGVVLEHQGRLSVRCDDCKKRPCDWCGTIFHARSVRDRFCNRACTNASTTERLRLARAAKRGPNYVPRYLFDESAVSIVIVCTKCDWRGLEFNQDEAEAESVKHTKVCISKKAVAANE